MWSRAERERVRERESRDRKRHVIQLQLTLMLDARAVRMLAAAAAASATVPVFDALLTLYRPRRFFGRTRSRHTHVHQQHNLIQPCSDATSN